MTQSAKPSTSRAHTAGRHAGTAHADTIWAPLDSGQAAAGHECFLWGASNGYHAVGCIERTIGGYSYPPAHDGVGQDVKYTEQPTLRCYDGATVIRCYSAYLVYEQFSGVGGHTYNTFACSACAATINYGATLTDTEVGLRGDQCYDGWYGKFDLGGTVHVTAGITEALGSNYYTNTHQVCLSELA